MINGFDDEDGCPDANHGDHPQVQALPGTIEGLVFQAYRTELNRRSSRLLDGIAEVLKRHPYVRISIEGHRDSLAKSYSTDLTRRRAAAVRDYLVMQGVEAERLEIRGAGPDEPIASNKTAEGRAKNNRIELALLNESRVEPGCKE